MVSLFKKRMPSIGYIMGNIVSKYAGIVGNKFFQNFNVIFDYKRKRLHIEKY